MDKQYEVSIYNASGTFILNLPARLPLTCSTDRKTIRNFRPRIISEINQGQGELSIDLNAIFDDFGEGVDIDFGFIVKVYCYDDNHPPPTGVLIFTGVITTYEPSLKGVEEVLKIQPLGHNAQLNDSYFRVGGAYEFNMNDKASEIFKDIIDHFQTIYTNSDIDYTGNVEDSVTTLDRDYSKVKWLDAIKQTHELAPTGWWWRIDPDGSAHFKSKPSAATHTFRLQKHISSIRVNKTNDSVVNDIILESSAPATPHTGTDAASQTAYGVRSLYITDTSIQDNTTAAARVAKELADRKDIKRRITCTVNDLYDLETIRPGDTCTVIGERIGGSLLIENMQIVRVEYSESFCSIILEEDYQSLVKQLKIFNDQ